MTPYYQDDLVTLYHGDALDFGNDGDPVLFHSGLSCPKRVDADGFCSCQFPPRALVTDPPYGIDYRSNKAGWLPRRIAGDLDTASRDWVLERWHGPALVFGTWRISRPAATHTLLVWDTGGALGMGNLSVPWKPSHQEVYVIGGGFVGHRTSDVLAFPPVQSTARNGRTHPHEKPVPLMRSLVKKCPEDMAIVDPFCGTGATLVAAKSLGRRAIGIEVDEAYCERAATRCSQEVLGLVG